MAVTVRTYDVNAGAGFWNSNDVLNTLQTALSDVGFHAAAQTGTILTFTNSGGGTIPSQKGKRYLVKQSATSGTGVYAVFDVFRNADTGAVAAVTLVNGGENYAATNTVTIAGADIGGVTPTDNITVTVSTVSGSQGSTTTWYDVDTASPATWAVCCVNIDKTKKLGQTYYSFHIPGNTTSISSPVTLYISAGPSFQTTTNVFNGVSGIDYVSSAPNNTTTQRYSQVISKSNANPLRLITYQSGVDTKFVVFQFADVTNYGDLYRDPFVLSNYNTATQPWSLDECYTAGVYAFARSQASNTYDCSIYSILYNNTIPKRQGEWGYTGLTSGNYGVRYNIGYWESMHGKRFNSAATTGIVSSYPTIYQRSLMDIVQSNLEYNPVITGLPINNTFLPVPYFMPSDFGITEVLGTNTISFNDLISVGATTKWKVIQFANNISSQTYNSSMALVAKTVN
jgi:hypothetical protein